MACALHMHVTACKHACEHTREHTLAAHRHLMRAKQHRFVRPPHVVEQRHGYAPALGHVDEDGLVWAPHYLYLPAARHRVQSSRQSCDLSLIVPGLCLCL